MSVRWASHPSRLLHLNLKIEKGLAFSDFVLYISRDLETATREVMRDAEVIFEWTVHPLRAEPKKLAVFVVSLVAVGLAVWLSFGELSWVVISLLFLLGALHRFWLPTLIRVSEREIEIRRWFIRTSHALSNYKRAEIGLRWVHLSTFSEVNRLDHYRGLLLPLADDGNEFKAFIRGRFESKEWE